MKRGSNNTINETRKRQMTERRIHQELDALAAQLKQIRLEAKFKYIAERAKHTQREQQGPR
jgi:hypothetical protein